MPTFAEKWLPIMKKWAPIILEKAIIFTIVSFYSVLVILQLLYQRVVKGVQIFRKELHKKPEVFDSDWVHQYVTLDDIQMHFVQSGNEGKPLMVLIHGFPEFWYSWRYQLKYFAKDYKVIAIDQRGYNESDKPPSVEHYNSKALAGDIAQLIKKLDYEKAVVVGHDWGSIVAWYTAIYHPQVVEKLIIMNAPHPGVGLENMRQSLKQFLASWYIFLFQAPFLPEFLVSVDDYKMLKNMMRGNHGGFRLNPKNFTDSDLEAWKYVFSQQGALSGPINFYRAALRYPSKITTNDIVKPPTLVIWGTADPFLIKEGAARSVECCEKGRVVYVEGASHWVQQDAPDDVNTHMEVFLNEAL